MPKTGRPKTVAFKEKDRVDIRLERATKASAIDNLPGVGHPDLSAYLRHCLDLLATGRAAAIPDLRVTQG